MPRSRPKQTRLERFRQRLSNVDALPQLALLGIVSGILTSAVTLAFRAAIELPLEHLLPGNDAENFEDLPLLAKLLLPLAGAIVIGLIIRKLPPAQARVGVVHVMERLSGFQGHLPLRNAIVQFVTGVIALVTGHSNGREGPAIHLGAAISSLLGQMGALPNNSIRTLVGCGSAAAIAASFNTPIAGVIFAMEVVMMEYTIASFIPVILASVVATVISRAAYGDQPAFDVPALSIQSLNEVWFVIFEGAVIGALAALFIVLARRMGVVAQKLAARSVMLPLLVAGVVTGAAAVVAPQVMGIGYDTVDGAILGEFGLTTLLLIAVLKLIVTAVSVGMRIPAGIIGPSLVMGAVVGVLLGQLGTALAPNHDVAPEIYGVIGMAAMMAALLQAPLAALMTVLELTANPHMILPAMLAIVVATMVTSEVFGQKSIFLSTLTGLGLTYPDDPFSQHLRRAGVASIMERSFTRLPSIVPLAQAQDGLTDNPTWIVVDRDNQPTCILSATDLRRYLESDEMQALQADHSERVEAHAAAELAAAAATEPESETDAEATAAPPEPIQAPEALSVRLMDIPALRKDIALVDMQATVHEAWQELGTRGVEAVCVRRITAPMITPIVGVLTSDDIDRYTRLKG